MGMRLTVVPVILLAAACAPDTPPDERGERPAASAAQQSFREGRIWAADIGADQAHLVYGTPETDDVELMLRCRPGGSAVDISFVRSNAESVDVWPFTLIAGRARATYEGSTAPTELGENAVIVSATTSVVSDPLLALSDAPTLTLEESGRSVEMRLNPEQRGEIDRFFAACRGS